MLELHTEYQPVRRYSGFRGSFHFIPVDQYKSDGQPVPNSDCDQQFLSSQQTKSGRFFSPRHPQNYPPGIACTFVFRALPGERIRLDLQGLSLGSDTDADNGTGCRLADPPSQDRVLIFDSDKEDANLLASFSTRCAPASRQQVVSPAGLLKLRFRANSDEHTGSGFAGRFAFVARHMLQPTQPMDRVAAGAALGEGYPTKRPRQYSERQLQFFSSSGKKEGAVTSPDFPSAYPPLTRVIYRFFAEPDETVCISFSSFSLGTGTGTCGLDFAGDRLLIFDGYGADFSNRVSARCGSRSVDDFWSEGRYLTLEFRSDGVVGPGELGFAATYRFFRRSAVPPEPPRPSPAPPVSEPPAARPRPPQPSTAEASSPDCPAEPVVIRGSAPMSGVARTRDFPLGYRRGVCTWDLRAAGGERIVVELRHVDLEPAPATGGALSGSGCSARSSADRVLVTKFLKEPGRERQEAAPPLVFCQVSRDHPVRVMSSSLGRLLVTFNATADSRTRGGLEFSYSFVRDFGVSGEFKVQNRSVGCYFEFRSWQSSTGSFTSPNYPHAYPESLACHYVFLARPEERIRIEFTNYDTESSRLCLPGDSDYVLVEECHRPNYRLQTFCGKPEPGTAYSVTRRTSCLRLSFVSNSQYSAAGFHANYFFEGRTSPGVLFSGLNNGAPPAAECPWLSRQLAAPLLLMAWQLCQTR
ncbi:hypothetical protein BOX15_Mlig000095g1 [Macrostomum lignano]|uniref:CUB domain-containing protein n=1 Tax=Macrostomum lignano TaxID=282301 RepID=A0A267E694_9PLAT|nr:hypothetical protein BOX15_Mlig000095g1 [Macrostomum lignano]